MFHRKLARRRDVQAVGHARSQAAAASRIDPREAGLVAVLLLLAAASWIVTSTQLNGMDMGRWTDPGPLGFSSPRGW